MKKHDMFGGSSQSHRPFGSRAESNGQPQILGVGGAGSNAAAAITTNDALTYLKQVKDMFQNNREKYDQFLEVMKDFKAQRTDTSGVILRVKELFKGHNNLILGFNTFLPKGFKITLAEDEPETPPKKTVEFEEAINFVTKIKQRFLHDELVYKSFLDILNMYRKEQKTITEVYQEVTVLFEDHHDLLEQFTRFLPDTSATPSRHHVPYGHSFLQRYDERSSAMPTLQHFPMDKHYWRDRMVAHADRDLSVDRPDVDDDKSMIKLNREHQRERRNRDQDDREYEHEIGRDFIQRLPDKKKSIRKVEGFGVNHIIASDEDKAKLKSMYKQEFSFCEKVKEKVSTPSEYQNFLNCLNIYSTEIITRTEFQSMVEDVLGKYPNLMDEFNGFLEHCESTDGYLAEVMNKKSLWDDGHVSESVRVDDKDKEMKLEMEGLKEKDRYKEKYMSKSIQELDLSNCQRSTPSYRLLPDDYPILSASQRSELGAQVLNDHWVSVTSGSEDYSFKHMRRNQYEESLFRCEDDRFELDMLLESVNSTYKRADELLNKLNDHTLNLESVFQVQDYFTSNNLRCMERLYSDHGLDVMDILRKNPALALPVILTRLKQKQEEWTKCRADFNKVWKEIYAKNHYKSLDHRSFYFKQQDSKNLSSKSLLAEIKEIKETKQNDDEEILQAVAAVSKRSLIPNLEYENNDIDLHEDLYKLIKYSCEEIFSTKEQVNQVTRLWTTFVEPMLAVPCRPYCAVEDTENAAKSKLHDGKSNISNNMEIDTAYEQVKPEGSGNDAMEDVANSCRGISVNGDAMIKDDHFNNLDCGGNLKMEEEKNTRPLGDNISVDKQQVDSAELLGNTNVSPVKGPDFSNGRINVSTEVLSGCGTTPLTLGNTDSNDAPDGRVNGDEPQSQGGDVAKSIALGNREQPDGPEARFTKIDKEEGELSPNGDFEEDIFAVYGDTTAMEEDMPNANHSLEAANGDADDEDSENESLGCELPTGSENDSRDEQEDEDVEEHDEELDDGTVESEGEADVMIGVAGGLSMSLPLSERFLRDLKPLVKHASLLSGGKENKCSRVFYGNDNFYVLFRLHQILYERILSAKMNCTAAELKGKTLKDTGSPNLHSRFMSALYSLLDGSADNAKFEDDCRSLIGNQSYVLFTLDKLIYKLAKQLQTVATDEVDNKLIQLYNYEKSRGSEKLYDVAYHDNARVVLQDETIYRFEFLSSPSSLSIELMDGGGEKPEAVSVSIEPNFTIYMHRHFLVGHSGKKEESNIMLQRNKCKYAGLDVISANDKAMKDVQMVNGLECKIACNSSKISYVLDTEDFFFRSRRKIINSSEVKSDSYSDQTRVQRFRKFLSAP